MTLIEHFFNVLFSGLVLGGVFIIRRFLNPQSLEDSAEHYLNFHQQILNPIDRYLMILSASAMGVGLTMLVHHHVWVYLPTKLMVEGLVCGLIALIILGGRIRPIDREFAVWRMDNLPEEWLKHRSRWLRLHTVQAVFSFLAFDFYLLAALIKIS